MPTSRRTPRSEGPAQSPLTEIKAVEARLASFVEKFEPSVARLIRASRAEIRRLLPTAVELVYDNYSFFVIGYSSTDRASDCIVSLAASSNGLGLSFYYGASLPDPDHLLNGEGKQNRFIRIPEVDTLRVPAVVRLIRAAARQGSEPLAKTGASRTVIKSVSAKQRPRRKPE
jgi:hypothetical protein